MKKIDLHTHTIPTPSDATFAFDLGKLVSYVQSCKIDALAITNHNIFDGAQYQTIVSAVDILVLPGIEINLEDGHLLLIADPSSVSDFSSRCEQVTRKIPDARASISVAELKEIFPDLSRYLLIPHHDKKPAVSAEYVSRLGETVRAGEVSSPKKFVYCKKDPGQIVPVYFSDARFDSGLSSFPIRQTFVDIGDVNFGAVKYALADRDKVFLTPHSGHSYFQANDRGLILSTGLNVVIGERSSGKSYTLNQLESSFERVKYIKQFSLVERSDADDSDRFNNVLRQKQSLFIQEYLKEFRSIVDEVALIDIEHDARTVEQYISSLLHHAREHEKADSFSRAQLFTESEFPIESHDSLKKLIESVFTLAENEEFRATIERHLSIASLRNLAIDLMEQFGSQRELVLKKMWTNDVVASAKSELQRRTAAVPISDVDFYQVAMNETRVGKFTELVNAIQNEREVFHQEIQAFRVVARTKKFGGAQELKSISGRQLSFAKAFQAYSVPYDFLVQLKSIDGLVATDYHKFFTNIEYKILNRFGFEVSGGERSEFRLLQEISDAMQFDMLLVDEPESSFDNLFLNNEVNQLLKEIAQKMPVVLVTHNSTVGASIKPDYIVHTKRVVAAAGVTYETYFGHPGDRLLKSVSGATHPNYRALIDCLEAGKEAYDERGSTYETLEN
jgi:hypothetical protein